MSLLVRPKDSREQPTIEVPYEGITHLVMVDIKLKTNRYELLWTAGLFGVNNPRSKALFTISDEQEEV